MPMPGLKKNPVGYTGRERRRSPRKAADYPIRIRFLSAEGETVERFSHTRNVSTEGILCVNTGSLEPGTKVEASIGVPSLSVPSLPAAQIDCVAKVVRSETGVVNSKGMFESLTALEFLDTPKISTRVSMYD